MARVYIGKNCVYESEDTADVLKHVVRMGGSARAKCCGLVFYPGFKGRWSEFAAHLAEHETDPTASGSIAQPALAPGEFVRSGVEPIVTPESEGEPSSWPTPETTTKKTRRSSAKRGGEGTATTTGDK